MSGGFLFGSFVLSLNSDFYAREPFALKNKIQYLVILLFASTPLFLCYDGGSFIEKRIIEQVFLPHIWSGSA